jgi:hypothetical protein
LFFKAGLLVLGEVPIAALQIRSHDSRIREIPDLVRRMVFWTRPARPKNPEDDFRRSTKMLVTYHTSDEVHEHVGGEMARVCGFRLESVSAHLPLPEGEHDALVVDLDSAPPPQRGALVEELASRMHEYPVAVHSFSLSDEDCLRLKSNNVRVFSKLDPQVFTSLEQAV